MKETIVMRVFDEEKNEWIENSAEVVDADKTKSSEYDRCHVCGYPWKYHHCKVTSLPHTIVCPIQ